MGPAWPAFQAPVGACGGRCSRWAANVAFHVGSCTVSGSALDPLSDHTRARSHPVMDACRVSMHAHLWLRRVAQWDAPSADARRMQSVSMHARWIIVRRQRRRRCFPCPRLALWAAGAAPHHCNAACHVVGPQCSCQRARLQGVSGGHASLVHAVCGPGMRLVHAKARCVCRLRSMAALRSHFAGSSPAGGRADSSLWLARAKQHPSTVQQHGMPKRNRCGVPIDWGWSACTSSPVLHTQPACPMDLAHRPHMPRPI